MAAATAGWPSTISTRWASRRWPPLGVEVADGEAVMEEARLVKSADEILAMRRAIVACEAAMAEMEAKLAPGISENALWAELHRGNIARGGEWVETRLLSSGPRTNPWFQECSARTIEAGELVAFDTDLIGPYGFCADLSRSWLCGDGPPSAEQRELYSIAAEQIAVNTALLRPGVGFRELAERATNPPPDCFPARYGVLFHGVGLADEYPTLPHLADWTDDTPDGVVDARNGALRGKLYRPPGRPRRRQARRAGADHRDRARDAVDLSAGPSPLRALRAPLRPTPGPGACAPRSRRGSRAR